MILRVCIRTGGNKLVLKMVLVSLGTLHSEVPPNLCHVSLVFTEVIPWRRAWPPTPVCLPGKSHGWRNLAGYSTWDHKKSDTTELLHFITQLDFLYLENNLKFHISLEFLHTYQNQGAFFPCMIHLYILFCIFLPLWLDLNLFYIFLCVYLYVCLSLYHFWLTSEDP